MGLSRTKEGESEDPPPVAPVRPSIRTARQAAQKSIRPGRSPEWHGDCWIEPASPRRQGDRWPFRFNEYFRQLAPGEYHISLLATGTYALMPKFISQREKKEKMRAIAPLDSSGPLGFTTIVNTFCEFKDNELIFFC